MRVLVLSAYAAQSHVQWLEQFQTMFQQWQWTTLSLPPRHFSWRIRGNALYWSIEHRQTLESEYDLLIATSMVDMATLRGLVPSLCAIPTLLYFHENQFEYPVQGQQGVLEAQITSIYSALTADHLAFNSSYNRDTFVRGVEHLMAKLPDFVPPGVAALLNAKSGVLPVPVNNAREDSAQAWWPSEPVDGRTQPLRIQWLGRLEFDKGGEELECVLHELESAGLDYELAVTGQVFRQVPAVFERIQRDYAHRIVQFGYVEDRDWYHALQHGADIALSTALHEFQGLAIMEAVLRGSVPVVPDRLAYTHIYPDANRYRSVPEDRVEEAISAVDVIGVVAQRLSAGEDCSVDLSAYCLPMMKLQYAHVCQALVASADSQ